MALVHRCLVGAVLGSVLGSLISAYYIYIKVPAVVSIRPNLTDVGFWTGVFSGRGGAYLYLHYPEPIVAVTIVFWAVVGFIMLGPWVKFA